MNNMNKICYWIDWCVYLLRLLLSYTKQAPVSLQDSCHRIHESSISVPNIIGARSPVKRAAINLILSKTFLHCSKPNIFKFAMHFTWYSTQYPYNDPLNSQRKWTLFTVNAPEKLKRYPSKSDMFQSLRKSIKPYLRVADKAGIVAKNVKNMTKKHRPTKYHKLLQLLVHIVLIASNPRSTVRFGAFMHSQSK